MHGEIMIQDQRAKSLHHQCKQVQQIAQIFVCVYAGGKGGKTEGVLARVRLETQ